MLVMFGRTRAFLLGFRDGWTVNAAQVEAAADYLHVPPLRLRWALETLGLTVADEGRAEA